MPYIQKKKKKVKMKKIEKENTRRVYIIEQNKIGFGKQTKSYSEKSKGVWEMQLHLRLKLQPTAEGLVKSDELVVKLRKLAS